MSRCPPFLRIVPDQRLDIVTIEFVAAFEKVQLHEEQQPDNLPLYASDEEAMRRKAAREAAKVREIYEEMVLGKKPEALVTIGTLAPSNGGSKPVTIQPMKKAEEQELAGIAGD